MRLKIIIVMLLIIMLNFCSISLSKVMPECGESQNGKHKTVEATCTLPKKCLLCGETFGKALGHQYLYGRLNEKQHTVRCYRCKNEKSPESHNFNSNNKCEKCGWTKPATKCKEHKYMQVEYDAPTCQKEGYKVSACTVCKMIKTESYKKTNHVYEDATCTKAQKCIKCDEIFGKPLGHMYVEATCTSPRKCTRKGCNLVEGKALEHDYIDASCTQAKVCSRCLVESGEPLGHQYLYGMLNEKQHTVRCYRCKDEKRPESHEFNNNNKCEKCGWTKPAIKCKEHKYVQVEYEAPTCKKEGYKYFVCTECKMTKTEKYKKTNHEYEKATCFVAKKCKNCDVTFGKPLEHDYFYEKIDKEKHLKYCENCNQEKIKEEHKINIFGICSYCKYNKNKCDHSVTEKVIIKEPDCYTTGLENIVCVDCKKILETKTLEKNHRYMFFTTKAATCFKEGVKEQICAICGELGEEKPLIIQKKPHNYDDFGKCTECGHEDISKVRCQFPKDKHTNYDVIYTKTKDKHTKTEYCLECKKLFKTTEIHNFIDGFKCECGATKNIIHCECGSQKVKEVYSKNKNERFHDVKVVCESCKKTLRSTINQAHIIKNGECPCGIKAKLTLSASEVKLIPGESIKIDAKYNLGSSEEIIWESSNSKIVTVENGLITATKETFSGSNKATVSAKVGNLVKYVNVTINKNGKANIQISGPNEAYIGETINVIATLTSNGNSGKDLVWTSSGIEHKITVSQSTTNAWIRSQKSGNISIKVKYEYEDGKYVTATHSVKILKTNQSSLKEKIVLVQGSITNFGGDVLKKISGESIIVLGTSIKAEKPGSSIIEDSNGIRYEVLVVENEINIISATINIKKSIYVGEETSFSVTTNPSLTTAEYKIVASNAISLSSNGTIKGVKKGNGILKLICNNKTLTQVEIQVKEEKVSINNDNNAGLVIGENNSVRVPILLDVSEQTRKELEITYICDSPFIEIDESGNIKIKGDFELSEREKIRVDVVVKRGDKVIYDSRGKRNSEVTSVYVYPKEKVIESVEDGRVIEKGNAKFYESLDVETGKNTLIYCGGAGERMNLEGAMEHIKDQPALENWNQYALTMLYPKNPKEQPVEDWEAPANDMIKYIEAQVIEGKMDPNNIYIDGMSNGGYGAYYLAKELDGRTVVKSDGEEVKISVKKLTLIDGAIDYKIGENEVSELLNAGIEVQIYACPEKKNEYKVSKNGRKLIERFEGTEGFTGIKLTTGHSAKGMIEEVYNERGLHENDN